MPGALNVPSVVSNLTGDVTGNVVATSGTSIFAGLQMDVSTHFQTGEFGASRIGIGTTCSFSRLRINEDADKRFSVGDSGNVGIKTTDLNGNALFVSGDTVTEIIGVGTNQARAAVDFADAGQALGGVKANRMYMIPPKVTTAQRANLVGVVSGAVIYNTSLNKLQVYVGSGAYNVANWQNCN